MVIPERHTILWSQTLFACLQEMAERQTNPSLLILDGVETIESERRYPDDSLFFANDQWRAFYHCHDAPNKRIEEHGHFHLFTREQADWSHVVGLSIDHYGQPLHWFSVNRWVTGGPWLSRDAFIRHLDNDHYSSDDPLVGRWLFAMLQVYRGVLRDLFAQRNRHLDTLARNRADGELFEDRNIYTLASSAVDIQTTLEACLSALQTYRHERQSDSADVRH